MLGTPVVPFFQFFEGLLIITECKEKGYPCHSGVTGEPSLVGGV